MAAVALADEAHHSRTSADFVVELGACAAYGLGASFKWPIDQEPA
jgi:hypothetical protein